LTGLANFDGTTWTHYLPGRCVLAFDIGPDGTVWLQAAGQGIEFPFEPDEADKTETLVIPGWVGPTHRGRLSAANGEVSPADAVQIHEPTPTTGVPTVHEGTSPDVKARFHGIVDRSPYVAMPPTRPTGSGLRTSSGVRS
jgi:hypothetical protein